MGGRATLHDVASAAGYPGRPRRVLAGTDRNVDPTWPAGLAASEELGYRANPVARALRRQSTGNFGILVPSIRNPYFVHLVDAFTQWRAGRAGWCLPTRATTLTSRRPGSRRSPLLVDGLAVCPPRCPAAGRPSGGPASAPSGPGGPLGDGRRCGFVGVDNELASHGARLPARLRRQRIVFVGAEQETSAGKERLAAFRARRGRATARSCSPTSLPRPGGTRPPSAERGDLPDAALCSATCWPSACSAPVEAGRAVPTTSPSPLRRHRPAGAGRPADQRLRHPVEAIAARALAMLLGTESPAWSDCGRHGAALHHLSSPGGPRNPATRAAESSDSRVVSGVAGAGVVGGEQRAGCGAQVLPEGGAAYSVWPVPGAQLRYDVLDEVDERAGDRVARLNPSPGLVDPALQLVGHRRPEPTTTGPPPIAMTGPTRRPSSPVRVSGGEAGERGPGASVSTYSTADPATRPPVDAGQPPNRPSRPRGWRTAGRSPAWRAPRRRWPGDRGQHGEHLDRAWVAPAPRRRRTPATERRTTPGFGPLTNTASACVRRSGCPSVRRRPGRSPGCAAATARRGTAWHVEVAALVLDIVHLGRVGEDSPLGVAHHRVGLPGALQSCSRPPGILGQLERWSCGICSPSPRLRAALSR